MSSASNGFKSLTLRKNPPLSLKLSRGGLSLNQPKKCRQLEVRKEWRDLSAANKRSYIGAVKCLQSSRAFNRTLPAKFTRFDEFVKLHMDVADGIHDHGVAQFLPWHRHFGYLYHQALNSHISISTLIKAIL